MMLKLSNIVPRSYVSCMNLFSKNGNDSFSVKDNIYMDKIFLLRHSRVLEEGSHEKLMNDKGEYFIYLRNRLKCGMNLKRKYDFLREYDFSDSYILLPCI